MRLNRAAMAALGVAGLALGGCTHVSNALGVGKNSPDEFRVVARAPLVVPPDYSLRPPTPGEPRPQELQPESAAHVALLGQQEAVARSDGEKILVTKAGGDKADPLVRYVVDDEFGDLAHKDKSFADKVMFWHKDPATAGTPGATKLAQAAEKPDPVDAQAESLATKRLVGTQQIVIQRDKRDSFIKLPGL
jgi:hypothetical protein